jgi:hypothetical protein
VLHNVWYDGAAFSEPITHTLGPVTLSTGAIDMDSGLTADSTTISVTTGLPLPQGLAVTGYGLSGREVLHDLPIQAQGTYFYEETFTNTASLEVSTGSATQMDLYLYLDYWDGSRWLWLGGGGGGPFQYVRIEPAQDGRYRMRIDGGANVPPGGSVFDLTIKAVRGGDLTVSPPTVPGPIAAGTTLTFTIGYNRPNLIPGIYDGKVFIGPTDAPALVSLPFSLRYGDPTPEPTTTPYPCIPDIRDVPTSHWAYPYIRDLYCRGIVTGYLDRTFHPNDPTSRVQYLAMEGRANGWPWITPTPATFSDVPPSHWGYGYVEYAASAGLINGYADGTFRPIAPVTRAQVAKLITLAARWPTTPPANPPTFSDVPPTHWAYAYIGQLVAHGFAGGYADGTFKPEAPITRAQISKILDLWILNGSLNRPR